MAELPELERAGTRNSHCARRTKFRRRSSWFSSFELQVLMFELRQFRVFRPFAGAGGEPRAWSRLWADMEISRGMLRWNLRIENLYFSLGRARNC